MASQVVTATEFKAKCLAMLNDVNKNGGTITVTKHGRPVAVVGPAKRLKFRSSEGILRGIVDIPDEILMADMSDMWECVRGKETFEL